ncbi:hypothetical protein E2C01_029258 [Portunus trituberculatus]|uniref:Uncharacterized protein n=1 Tax=Portunus trituberculatus TaxID=210409 RepID=A0A5B7EMU0_PORTR|nr:hypothetical protein [Portunus trituberculatus]
MSSIHMSQTLPS